MRPGQHLDLLPDAGPILVAFVDVVTVDAGVEMPVWNSPGIFAHGRMHRRVDRGEDLGEAFLAFVELRRLLPVRPKVGTEGWASVGDGSVFAVGAEALGCLPEALWLAPHHRPRERQGSPKT